MIKKIYYWFHKFISRPDEKNKPSGGVWSDCVRQQALRLCGQYQGTILEIGCGEGLFIHQLARYNSQISIIGLDNNKVKLSWAAKIAQDEQLKVQTIFADGKQLPFEDERFDAVVCINVFYNLDSFEAVKNVIKEAARVCKSKGKFVFDFRNSLNPIVCLKYGLAKVYDETVYDLPLRAYQINNMSEVLNMHGFKVNKKLQLGFPGGWLAPIIIIEAVKRV